MIEPSQETLTARDALRHIEETHQAISETIARCRSLPYPDAHRFERIRELEREASRCVNQAAVEKAIIQRPVTEKVADLAETIRREQSNVEAKSREIHARHEKATQEIDWNQPVDKLLAKQRELQDRLNVRSEALKPRFIALEAQRQEYDSLRLRSHEEAEALLSTPAPSALLDSMSNLDTLLNRTGDLERDLNRTSEQSFLSEAATFFKESREEFTAAQHEHENSASLATTGLFAAIVAGALVILSLFLSSESKLDHTDTTRIVLFSSGRLAILFFLGWIFKYLTSLQQMHSEQAVVYHDKRAALSVSEQLLRATTELEQRREILRTLMSAYIHFDRNAFMLRRTRTDDNSPSFDNQVVRLQKVVDAVKPLLDLTGKASDHEKKP